MPGRAISREDRAAVRDDRFTAALDAQHTLAVRTSEELRKLVLLGDGKSELVAFTRGKVDPYLQLMLVARDEYEKAEEGSDRLGFFKEMRAMYAAADAKVQAALEMAMKERHHRERMDALREKAGLEPSEDEVRSLAASE